MILELTLIAATFQQQKTVAVKLDPNQPAIIMSEDEAEKRYQQLIEFNDDEKLFQALTIALGKMPDTVFCSLHKLCLSHQQIRHMAGCDKEK